MSENTTPLIPISAETTRAHYEKDNLIRSLATENEALRADIKALKQILAKYGDAEITTTHKAMTHEEKTKAIKAMEWMYHGLIDAENIVTNLRNNIIEEEETAPFDHLTSITITGAAIRLGDAIHFIFQAKSAMRQRMNELGYEE